MARKHHPPWEPTAADRALAAALGPDAAFVPIEGGWAFARCTPCLHAPRSAVLDLVTGAHEAWPDAARGLLRRRIRATAQAPFDRDVVRVTAKRVSLVPPAPGPVGDPLHDLGPAAARARAMAEDALGSGPGVTARLEADGTVLEARNALSANATFHAEIVLLLGWWARTGRGLPAGARIRVSLQPCRMCAALIVACACGPVEVAYDAPDPGPFARGTALQRLGWERAS